MEESVFQNSDLNPWPIIATLCAGALTITLYSACTAKRVTSLETINKMQNSKSRVQIEKPTTGCFTRFIVACMNSCKSSRHPISYPESQNLTVKRIQNSKGTQTGPI